MPSADELLSGEDSAINERRPRRWQQRIGWVVLLVGMGLTVWAFVQPGGADRTDFLNSGILLVAGFGLVIGGRTIMNYDPARSGVSDGTSPLLIVENLAGGLFCLCLSMCVAGVGIMEFVSALHNKQGLFPRWLWLTLPLACALLDLWFMIAVILVWSRSPVALAISVAVRLPLAPLLLRPLIAAVWLGHFLVGAVAVVAVEKEMIPHLHGAADFIPAALLLLAQMYASNTFLLAAAGA